MVPQLRDGRLPIVVETDIRQSAAGRVGLAQGKVIPFGFPMRRYSFTLRRFPDLRRIAVAVQLLLFLLRQNHAPDLDCTAGRIGARICAGQVDVQRIAVAWPLNIIAIGIMIGVCACNARDRDRVRAAAVRCNRAALNGRLAAEAVIARRRNRFCKAHINSRDHPVVLCGLFAVLRIVRKRNVGLECFAGIEQPLAVSAVRIAGEGQFKGRLGGSCRCSLFRAGRRQRTKAGCRSQSFFFNLAVHIAHGCRFRIQHDAGMLRRAVAVQIIKCDVAGLRGIACCIAIQLLRRKRGEPARAGIRARESLAHTGLVQTIACKQRRPVIGVGIAIRCAVAGVAVCRLAVGRDGVIFAAFRIAELRLCDRRRIGCGIAAERGQRRRYGICVRIGAAGKRMRVFFQLTRQNGFRRALFFSADKRFLRGVAILRVRVCVSFFLPADRIAVLVIARVAVRMSLRLGKPAGQDGRFLIAVLCMYMRLPLRIAARFLRMRMRLLAAERLAGHGNGREDQRIGRAEHDKTGQHRNDLLPALFLQMRFEITCDI